jgi:hypothetical protein
MIIGLPGLWSQMWREIVFPYLRVEPWRADPQEGEDQGI